MPVMTIQEIRNTILRILGEIAPEVDLGAIQPAVSLRDQLDIDSMDLLNFVIAVDARLHVDIPERDYPKLATLDAFVHYIAQRLPDTSTTGSSTRAD